MFRINSKFIAAPSRKMIRVSQDLTSEHEQSRSIDAAGAVVRIDLTAWQDEAEKIDREALKQFYLDQGALGVDIRITRLPRENIRADAVLKAETLRDKLIAAAELRGETVSESILEKADALEHLDADKLIAGIGSI